HVLEEGGGQTDERVVHLVPLFETYRRHPPRRQPSRRVGFVDSDQPVRRWVGKRPEKHGVDGREDRAVRADAQRQRRNDGQRKSWTVSKGAKGGSKRVRHAKLPSDSTAGAPLRLTASGRVHRELHRTGKIVC